MRKTRALVIIVFIYVLVQFSWWAYMLVSLNKEVYSHKIELATLQELNHPKQEQLIQSLKQKLNSRWWMIAGEGIVFIGLLIFGIYKILEAYSREVALARQQKNFLLSITHEFKSPLAAVKLNMQTLQKHQLTEQQTKQIIQSSVDETDRLNRLVEDTLIAAQIEAHTYSLNMEKLNLSECIQKSLQSRMIVSFRENSITTDITEDVFINGDCMAINSIVVNLVDNAEKYSSDDAAILVSLRQKNKDVILEVSDNGIGIPDTEKEKIFQKFYRIGNEDTRNTKGTGLGLYIVQQLVKMHGGTIEVLDHKPRGTKFRIAFHM